MLSVVFGELDIINEVYLSSDKCNLVDLAKMTADYQRDLEKNKYPSKVTITKYLKDKPDKASQKDGQNDGQKKEGSKSPTKDSGDKGDEPVIFDTIMSRNPKMNLYLAPGLS